MSMTVEKITNSIQSWIYELEDQKELLEKKGEDVSIRSKIIEALDKLKTEMTGFHKYLLNPEKKITFAPAKIEVEDLTIQLANQVGVFVILADKNNQMIKKPILVSRNIADVEKLKYSLRTDTTSRSFEVERRYIDIETDGIKLEKWIPITVEGVKILVSDGRKAHYIDLDEGNDPKKSVKKRTEQVSA